MTFKLITNAVSKREFGMSMPFSRLDAEFVDPKVLAIEKAIEARGGRQLTHVALRVNGSFTASDNPNDSIPYIPIDAIDTIDGMIFPDLVRVGELPSRARWKVQEGDILVSNVRPNRGAVALVSKRLAGYIASSGFTVVRAALDQTVSQEFIFAFLKTTYGRDQLTRRNRGSMYPAVMADDVFDVWIPKPTVSVENTVTAQITKALASQEAFYTLHEKTARLLADFLEPYGAPPSPLESDGRAIDWTEITAKSVFDLHEARRLDAEFFRQCYRAFDDRCRHLGSSFLLGEHFDLFPGRALLNGAASVPYAKQAILTNIGINWSALVEEQGTIPRGPAKLQEGDILLACTAHEIAYVGRKVDPLRSIPEYISRPIGCVADIIIIRPKRTKPAKIYGSYVAAFLRYPAGLHQVQRCIRGLRGGHVYKDDLSTFVRIPIPSDKWLDRFEAKMEQAEQARNDAKAAMQSGFTAVEQFLAPMV